MFVILLMFSGLGFLSFLFCSVVACFLSLIGVFVAL